MTHAPVIDVGAEPIAFGREQRPLLGWLHRPASAAHRDAAVVICNPFGYEAICSHRSLLHFARAAARAGVTALRFDYDGTGDSSGSDLDPGRLDAWVASVGDAIDEVKRQAGTDRVFLLGVRLGATLAALSADRDDVAGVIAIAPVVSGKRWLREIDALQHAMRFPPPPAAEPPREGITESAGFVLTEETRRSIEQIELTSQAPPRAVLLLDRDDLPTAGALRDRYVAQGGDVEYRALPGYVEMMLDPHEARVPDAMIHATSGWLVRHSTDRSRPPSRATASTRWCAGPMMVADGVHEFATYFGDERRLFGVLSVPAAQTPQRAIVLLNAGANSHIGPNRLYVTLARRWAARGDAVLRLDVAGIGESRAYEGDADHVVYAASAVRSLEETIEWLSERLGVTEVHALGLCSGAYHSLKAAAAGLPLASITLVNPLVFFWKPGMSLAYPAYQVSEAAARYRRSIFVLEKWKKVLAGRVSLGAFVNVIARRAVQHAGTFLRNVSRAAGRPLRNDLGAELQSVVSAGMAVRFVFAAGDPGYDLLTTDGGWAVKRLAQNGKVRIDRIVGPNHTFTPVWTHEVLTRVLESGLDIE